MRFSLRSSSLIGWLASVLIFCTTNHALAADQGFENDRCLDCHIAKTARTHPMGIAPPVADDSLVLTSDGTIGCVTCHFAHDTLPDGIGAKAIRMRVRCYTCHGSSVGHGTQPVLAHELRDTASGRAALKAQTRACIGCHDGSSGPDTHVNDGPQMFDEANQIYTANGDAPQLGRSHPILVDYARVVDEKPRTYRNNFEMSSVIQFEEGQLGCLSCHDLFNQAQEERLVQNNSKSALCLQCHKLSPSTDATGATPGLLALARRGLLNAYHGDPAVAAR